MLLPKLGSLCRCTLKSLIHEHFQSKQTVHKIKSALGGIRLYTTDESDNMDFDKRVPRAGTYRPAWKILKEEFEGIKTMKPAGTEVPRETDFLIIGGGIVGSSLAYHLKVLNPPGTSITIIERDPVYTKASSMLSWEGVRHQFCVPEYVQLSMYTSEFLCNIRQHLGVIHESSPDVQFNHHGYLMLAKEENAQQLAENVNMQKELGARVVLLTKKQLTEQYPWMDFDGIDCGSLGVEGEGWFDPWSLLRALKQKNISMGTKYINGEFIGFETVSVEHQDKTRFQLDCGVTRTKDGREYETKFFKAVNCAGPWAADVAEMAKIGTGEGDLAMPLPVEPRKRNVYVTNCSSGPTLDCPFVIDPSGLFFRRDGFGGHYICGHAPTSEAEEPPVANFDVDYNLYDEKVLPNLTKRVPCFSQSDLKAAWAGYIDYNFFDQDIVIGPHPYHDNFFFVNGLGGLAPQFALGIGRAITELVFKGEYETINLEKFHFDRFLENHPMKELEAV